MEKFKRLLWTLLFPHIAFVIILIPVATVLLIYGLGYENADPVITYVSYFLSAYTLTIVCVRIPDIYISVKTASDKNKYINRYMTDIGVRTTISLYISLGMNILYAIMQLYLGIVNHSIWFYALVVYYLLLVLMRFLLLKESRKNRLGTDAFFEYLYYRLCGVILVFMNIALAVVVSYIVWQNRGFAHHEILTIAMAAYTFFSLTKAIINLVRYRKSGSPILSATMVISFAAALVSLLSLETAMLTAFGDESIALFRQIVTSLTGFAVCTSVFIMAIVMIVQSTKEIKRLKGAMNHGK